MAQNNEKVNSEKFRRLFNDEELAKIDKDCEDHVNEHFNPTPVNTTLNESEIRLHFEEMLGAAGFLEHLISEFYDMIQNHKTLPNEHKKIIIDQLKEKNISTIETIGAFLKIKKDYGIQDPFADP